MSHLGGTALFLASRTPSLSMTDLALADLVSSALVGNPHVPQRTLRIETQQGRVILRGVVKSYYQKQMAQEVLRGLEGVAEIENQLEVSWC